jgi:DNA-binding NtrC family response regulator
VLALLRRASLFSSDRSHGHCARRDDLRGSGVSVAQSDAILIIDDEPSVADALRLILGDQGHRVLVAATGRGGLELARRERVRVVITDLRLPDISGLDVLGALRRERPHLPVILITSHGTPELSAEARRAGAMAVLDKPFAPAEIISLVAGCD